MIKYEVVVYSGGSRFTHNVDADEMIIRDGLIIFYVNNVLKEMFPVSRTVVRTK